MSANAGELLTLAQQFNVGSFWYGRRDRAGGGLLGPGQLPGRPGRHAQTPGAGPAPGRSGPRGLAVRQTGPGRGSGPGVTYQGRRVLLVPPVRGLAADALPVVAGSLEALVLPVELSTSENRNHIMARLKPRRVVVYGDPGRPRAARSPWPAPCQFTREGAVSLYLDAAGVTARQWRPQE